MPQAVRVEQMLRGERFVALVAPVPLLLLRRVDQQVVLVQRLLLAELDAARHAPVHQLPAVRLQVHLERPSPRVLSIAAHRVPRLAVYLPVVFQQCGKGKARSLLASLAAVRIVRLPVAIVAKQLQRTAANAAQGQTYPGEWSVSCRAVVILLQRYERFRGGRFRCLLERCQRNVCILVGIFVLFGRFIVAFW